MFWPVLRLLNHTLPVCSFFYQRVGEMVNVRRKRRKERGGRERRTERDGISI